MNLNHLTSVTRKKSRGWLRFRPAESPRNWCTSLHSQRWCKVGASNPITSSSQKAETFGHGHGSHGDVATIGVFHKLLHNELKKDHQHFFLLGSTISIDAMASIAILT